MIFAPGDYVELEHAPGVVWQVERIHFNGGNPGASVKLVGFDADTSWDLATTHYGFQACSNEPFFTYDNFVEANAMLVLALECR